MNNQIRQAIEQMFIIGGYKVPDNLDELVKQEGWYQKYQWTPEEELEYMDWFMDFLLDNYSAFMDFKPHSKRIRENTADMFILSYGFLTNQHKYANARTKISLALKGRPKTPEHRQKISQANKNKPKSSQHKQNISKSMKGKPKSEEHKKKISQAKKKKESQFVK